MDLTGRENYDASKSLMKFLKPYKGQYIALSSPFLANMDRWGFLAGSMKNATDLINHNVNSWKDGTALTKWAFFIPNGCALDSFTHLIDAHMVN